MISGICVEVLPSMILKKKTFDKYNHLNGLIYLDILKNKELHDLIIKWINNSKIEYGQKNGGIVKYLNWVIENITIQVYNHYNLKNYKNVMKLMNHHEIFSINTFWEKDNALNLEEYARMHYLIYKEIKSI